MKNDRFTRKRVKDLDAYRVVPPDYDVILNANENPFDFPKELKEEFFDVLRDESFNRYPDPTATEVRKLLSDYTGVAADQIVVGCGSDEIMNMIGQTFLEPNDVVLSHQPSFSMYDIWTQIDGGKFIWVPDKETGYHDVEGLINTAKEHRAKLIYLCSPNNPTGNLFPRHDVIQILEESGAIVILDEAYIEFKSPQDSLAELVDNYDNLIVMRTLSKAFGLAGIRCGYCLGPKHLIDMIYKVKSPYNLNKLTQAAAVVALKHRDALLSRINVLSVERRKVYRALQKADIEAVYPTAANFIYFRTSRGDELNQALLDHSILVKYYGKDGDDDLQSFRLTIGSPEENAKVLAVIDEVLG